MQGDGFQQSENAADPHGPQSPLAALVVAGLFATSFALGALGTHLLLTGKWVPFQEVSAPPLDVASDAASRAVPSKDAGELEVADRDAEPGAPPPPVLPSGSPLPEWARTSTQRDEAVPRDEAVLAVDSLRSPASSLPRASLSPSSALEEPEVVFDLPIGGNVILPVKTRNVRPAYPDLARRARIGGVVVLEAVITAEGRVADVRVVDSAPMLDAAAVTAIRQWQYEPGQLNRMPVPVPLTVNVTFSLY